MALFEDRMFTLDAVLSGAGVRIHPKLKATWRVRPNSTMTGKGWEQVGDNYLPIASHIPELEDDHKAAPFLHTLFICLG